MYVKKIYTLFVDGLGKSSLMLFSGSAFSQIINFVSIPIIARIFLPEHFGIVAGITSVSAILAVVSSGRYDLAIPLPKTDADGFLTMILSGFVSLAFNLIVLSVLFIIHAVGFSESDSYFVFLIPLLTFLTSINNIMTLWFTRVKQFKTIFWCRIILAVTTIVSQIVLSVVLGASGAVFIAGLLLGQLGAILFSRFEMNSITIDRHHLWGAIGNIASRYRRFPLVEMWGALLNTISGNFPYLFLTKYWTPWHVGQYSMMQKIVIGPSGALSTSVSQVFFGKMSEAKNRGNNLFEDSKRVYLLLFAIGILPFGAFGFGGRQIFALILGEQWATSGVYSQFMSIGFLFQFAYQPISFLLIVMGKQSFVLKMNILFLLLTVFSFYFGQWIDSDALEPTIMLLSISYSLVYLIFSLLIFRMTKINYAEQQTKISEG